MELNITTIAINTTETPPTFKEKKLGTTQSDIPSDFITSPTDVASLQDFKVTEEEMQAFKDLCEKYSDVFSENSGDIGRTS